MNVLRDLAEFGIGISIDDFGTGYTSIRYLRDFPAKELKILSIKDLSIRMRQIESISF